MARVQHVTEFRRVKWFFLVLGILIAAIPPSPVYVFVYGLSVVPDTATLLVSTLVASALAWYVGRDIWLLRVRNNSLWIDVLTFLVTLAILGVAVVQHERNIWPWNFFSPDVFFILFSSLVVCVAWFTENRRNVRVYFGARNYLFINARSDL